MSTAPATPAIPSTTPNAAPAGIMETLKTETAEHHQSAERHPFQRAMFSGALPREGYAANLGQMMLVNRELAAGVKTLAATDPRARAVVREHQFHENDFAADLAHFGVNASTIKPLPAIIDLTREMREMFKARPLAALGMHYVLEGATNGGQYIAKGVRRAYKLEGSDGTRSLDPYTDRQRELWAEFKTNMNAGAFSTAETRDLVEGAQWMFDAVSRVGTAVLESTKAG